MADVLTKKGVVAVGATPGWIRLEMARTRCRRVRVCRANGDAVIPSKHLVQYLNSWENKLYSLYFIMEWTQI